MACLVLANQLPSTMTDSIQSWLGKPEHQDVSNLQAREFLILVRKELNAEGIPQDWGNINFGAVKLIHDAGDIPIESDAENKDTFKHVLGESDQGTIELEVNHGDVLSASSRQGRGGFSRNRGATMKPPNPWKPNGNPRWKSNQVCWIYGKGAHMSFNCSKCFCQKCGNAGI